MKRLGVVAWTAVGAAAATACDRWVIVESGGDGVFALRDASYGRRLDAATGARLVSPLTTVDTDPVTGAVLEASLAPLAPGVDLVARVTLDPAQGASAPVVPRNAVLALRFSRPVDPGSLTADSIGQDGALLEAGSVQVRGADGRPVQVALELGEPDVVWIDARVGGAAGFPASPLAFGTDGAPLLDPQGGVTVVLPREGAAVLRAAGGTPLTSGAGRFGSPELPIRFHPGHAELDFVEHGALLPLHERWNGFLPDRSPPRIVRDHVAAFAFDPAAGDAAGADWLRFAAASFSTAAKAGRGEWAGATLVVRPGAGDEERLDVAGNGADTLELARPFAGPPRAGDACRLERIELFEPDPLDPIEPARFDPENPEIARNALLASFVVAREIDRDGAPVGGPLALDAQLPTYCELALRFHEPIDRASARPWETLRVAALPDEGEGAELLYEVVVAGDGRIATIRPLRRDPLAGTAELVGWGRGTRDLQLIVTAVPRRSWLAQHLDSAALDDFLAQGFCGVTDLGGEPLGHPESALDPAAPVARFAAPFTVSETAITQPDPPPVRSWGVIVHRMRGRPLTGIDPATELPAVAFRDQQDGYRAIAEVHLHVEGRLSGAPVAWITKVHDEFFPPPIGQFDPMPYGLPEPLASNVAAAPAAHDGCRFQTVWRDVDCSPNRDHLAGTLLDLWRVSFAPIGGNVTADHYENVSIHCAHSPVRPISHRTGDDPSEPYSGLSVPFDFAGWLGEVDGSDPCPTVNCNLNDTPNHWDTPLTVVSPGTSFSVSQESLFTPPGDGNTWHPWPAFEVRFPYNNGDVPQEERELRDLINATYDCSGDPWSEYRTWHADPEQDNSGGDSLLFEVRIRPQAAALSGRNGLSYVDACRVTWYYFRPLWRVFSAGSPASPLNPDALHTELAARCASGNRTSTSSRYGDDSRILAVFDWVKTTSRVVSPWVRVHPAGAVAPDWHPAIVELAPGGLPRGTALRLEFEGALGRMGPGRTGYSPSVDVADGLRNIAFRAIFEGNPETGCVPVVETIAIPYLKPFE